MFRGILYRAEFIVQMWAGQGVILYQGHLRSMEEALTYRQQIERARRRSRVSMRKRRTRAIGYQQRSRISLSAEWRKFLGEVEYRE